MVGLRNPRYLNGFEVTLHEDLIERFYEENKNKKKGYLVFVNSMSDLFHEKVPLDFIQRCFDVMRRLPRQKFLILTKRAERMLELSGSLEWAENIMMGVSVENRQALGRMELLKKCPAKFKMVSMGPLVGDVGEFDPRGIDWIAVEGESIGSRSKRHGRVARFMEAGWVRKIRDICLKNSVNFTFKQWGGYDRKFSGSVLDGKVWDERPGYIFENHPTVWVKRICQDLAEAKNCAIFEKFLFGDWRRVLAARPEMLGEAKKYPSGWAAAAAENPALAAECPRGMFEKMSTASSLLLLGEAAELAGMLPEIKNFGTVDWQWLIKKQPALRAEALKYPSGYAAVLIEEGIEADEKSKHWKKMPINAWMPLLIKRPQHIKYCPRENWRWLDWERLAAHSPELARLRENP